MSPIAARGRQARLFPSTLVVDTAVAMTAATPSAMRPSPPRYRNDDWPSSTTHVHPMNSALITPIMTRTRRRPGVAAHAPVGPSAASAAPMSTVCARVSVP